ncbi:MULTISPECIES: hypothetical protein [Pseudanabaena]|jgi:hypothetical protein|uniref:hypothetical protein n=1 Tax=Pseudanabaena TaxID=1152 RepID=UPI002478B4CD|nr:MULTISPECIES: hypothetical protein [Pseudanabaena]MEA5488312.1 hypothetical protein [Pseudanabaena sp. CCNP1317]WGS72861.1 hypothetical protein OA858_02205 [Pseudanabaena galeata CCNP1313]
MLFKSYKNILPASVAFIGGIVFIVGQPEFALANHQAEYTPTERPRPKRTQGGGSRLTLQVTPPSFKLQPSQNIVL